ncbi:DUF2167 domain-containing protein [Paenibacillus radicis (ex Xue et al. 2023)]|uniref:DUF2167 domain-containing protein n=1 Tax=Paenibacillus radicis (ex Xue et al. 2023) TaxID=2972489 RepID=A0ABT1YI83_9BACL|nr:DUF2167 domain-containing protein [Paenibacillus radicis (ex Xue et al. 2023)]MCR8631963.1 DUF2167 domain-containing protein [Paenibacillus radicis (ex Xue et al. 2023)]
MKLGKMLLAAVVLLSIMKGQVWAEGDSTNNSKYNWVKGDTTVDLGTTSTLDLGKDFVFLNAVDTKQLLSDSHDKPNGTEIGSVYPADTKQNWSLFLEYRDSDHIKDEEKKNIDANALLQSYRDGTEQRNKDLPAEEHLRITGWDVKPFYDGITHYLTWSIAAADAKNRPLVNYNVRILSRTGYISAILVSDPEHRAEDEKVVSSQVLSAIKMKTGQRYEDFDESKDKVSEYGLTALILGGAGLAVAKKVGILAALVVLLKKFWIVIVLLLGGGWRWLKGHLARRRLLAEDALTQVSQQVPTAQDQSIPEKTALPATKDVA